MVNQYQNVSVVKMTGIEILNIIMLIGLIITNI